MHDQVAQRRFVTNQILQRMSRAPGTLGLSKSLR
jgi:hypothetical protein